MTNILSRGELSIFVAAVLLAFTDQQVFSVYIGIGFTLKLGYFLLHEDNDNQEPHTMVIFSKLFRDLFEIMTWPWFAMNAGGVMFLRVATIGSLFVIFIGGGLYWSAIELDLPPSVVEPLVKQANDEDSPIPLQVRAELISRLENGFEYGDFLWFMGRASVYCGEEIAFRAKTPLVHHLLVGLLRAFPTVNYLLLNVQAEVQNFKCTIKKEK